MSIFQEPGLHTDTSNPRDPVAMKARGFKWIVQQTQNGSNPVKPWNLEAYRQQGFKVGVWGVNYADGRSRSISNDCAMLLSSAAGADLLVMNVEYRMNVAQAQTFVKSLEAFTGPKALICLVGDLVAMKDSLKVFLDAGWQIIGETYTNDNHLLTPAEAEWQAQNAGIPVDKFSHALGMYYGHEGWVTGGEYAHLLGNLNDSRLSFKNAGRRFSCWMVEHGAEASYGALWVQTVQDNPTGSLVVEPEPEPPEESPPLTAYQAREEIVEIVRDWRRGVTRPSPSNRLLVIERIAKLTNTDTKWNSVKAEIDAALRRVGL